MALFQIGEPLTALVEKQEPYAVVDTKKGILSALDREHLSGFYDLVDVPWPLPLWLNEVGGWRFDREAGKFVASDLEGLKRAKKERVTAFRKTVEFGGIRVDGMIVATGKADQERLNSAVSNVERFGIDSIDFKTESGWVSLSPEQLRSLSQSVVKHVQRCFSLERKAHEAIDALKTQDEVIFFNFANDWDEIQNSVVLNPLEVEPEAAPPETQAKEPAESQEEAPAAAGENGKKRRKI